MHLNTFKISIFLILIFNKSAINCIDIVNDPPTNPDHKDKNNDTDLKFQDIGNNNDTIPQKIEVIKTNHPYITTDEDEPTTIRYFYKIPINQQHKLVYPNKINSMLFGNYMFEFDQHAKLPNKNVEYLTIYTCNHNKPILMIMNADSRKYFYSMKTKVETWTNYQLRYDGRFEKCIDTIGLTYYTETPLLGSLPDLSTRDFQKYSDEHKELLKELTPILECNTIDVTDDNLEIYINKPNIFTASFLFTDSYKVEPLTLVFGYKINKEQNDDMSYPNKIDKVKFANFNLEFDESAFLPTLDPEYIFIYTCNHLNPKLIALNGAKRSYFYSFDHNNNKWTNYKLKYDKRYAEFRDYNSVLNYQKIKDDLDGIYEAVEVIKQNCSENCVTNNLININNVEIFMK